MVSMMFGLTGFSPWIGTSARVGAIVAPKAANGWRIRVAASAAAPILECATWRKVVIVSVPERFEAAEAYLSIACA